MSVFIVSMPPAVFSDRPPESNTTPLPTSASGLPRAPAGAYVELEEPRRPVRALPDAEHAAHPLRLQLRVVEHLHRDAACRAAACRAAGDQVGRRLAIAAGSFTMSRAHVDRVARRRRRARAARLHLGAPPAPTTHLRNFDAVAFALVLEELVARRAPRPRRAPARQRPRSASARRRVEQAWSATTRPSLEVATGDGGRRGAARRA